MLPATFNVPIELPGATVPETSASPTVPAPPRRPPALTTSLPPSCPFTARAPVSIVVMPVKPLESPVKAMLLPVPAAISIRPSPLPLLRALPS